MARTRATRSYTNSRGERVTTTRRVGTLEKSGEAYRAGGISRIIIVWLWATSALFVGLGMGFSPVYGFAALGVMVIGGPLVWIAVVVADNRKERTAQRATPHRPSATVTIDDRSAQRARLKAIVLGDDPSTMAEVRAALRSVGIDQQDLDDAEARAVLGKQLAQGSASLTDIGLAAPVPRTPAKPTADHRTAATDTAWDEREAGEHRARAAAFRAERDKNVARLNAKRDGISVDEALAALVPPTIAREPSDTQMAEIDKPSWPASAEWRADPKCEAELRWWDGERFTHHRRGAASVPTGAADTLGVGIADEIQKLADLHARGILTDHEFATAKQTLISRLG